MIRPSGKIGQNLILDIHMIALIHQNHPLSFAQWQNPMRIWESKSQCNTSQKLNYQQSISDASQINITLECEWENHIHHIQFHVDRDMTYWCLWVIMQVPSCIHVAVLDFSALGVLLSGPLGCLAAGSDQDKIEL